MKTSREFDECVYVLEKLLLDSFRESCRRKNGKNPLSSNRGILNFAPLHSDAKQSTDWILDTYRILEFSVTKLKVEVWRYRA